MKQAKPRRQKKHKDRPVYFVVRQMADPSTGEVVGCLVPASWADNRLLRERKYRTNDHIRATLTHPRNSKFHRLVHQLGTVACQNLEGFEHMDSHAAIKKLQTDSGVYCEAREVSAAPVVAAIQQAAHSLLGEGVARMLSAVLPEIETVQILVPQSIAYDCMDESDFRQFWDGICQHLIDRYWPSLTEEQITEIAELMPHSEGL